jgi:hypothetical protein
LDWLHVSVKEPRNKAERSDMASFNQPNGTSTSFIPRLSDTPQTTQAKPSVPVIGPNFPTVDFSSTAYHDAYSRPSVQGRSRPSASYNAAPPSPTAQFPTWNAAALLNPRGFQKAQQKEERNFNAPLRNIPPSNIAFQFDSPTSSTALAQQAPSGVQNGNGNSYIWPSEPTPGIGMGHMLERMHNVSERDYLPQKRRKIERESEDDNAPKSQFSSGGKGGVLGEYMKEKQDQGRKEDAANGIRPSVDLTGGE